MFQTGDCENFIFFSTEYDLALSVMAASGKLSEFVAKQQEGKVHSTALGVWY